MQLSDFVFLFLHESDIAYYTDCKLLKNRHPQSLFVRDIIYDGLGLWVEVNGARRLSRASIQSRVDSESILLVAQDFIFSKTDSVRIKPSQAQWAVVGVL